MPEENKEITEQDLIDSDFRWGDYTPREKPIDLDEMTRNMFNPPKPTIDRESPLFFTEWLKNGRNATQAYRKQHPNVSIQSAAVLGSRMLARIDIPAIMSAYGLGYESYFEELKNGLEAKCINKTTGELEPDFKTRRVYHKVLGKLLEIE